jgi:glycosyltransferase involved in cell wall biosynthesis
MDEANMKILHIVPDLCSGNLQRDLLLLLDGHADETVAVCTLGTGGAELRARGVSVEALAWTRRLDPRPLYRLGRLVRDAQPDTVHVWGLPALRALRLAASTWQGRVVVNRPLSCVSSLNAVDRWLLRGVERILVRGPAEAARCRQAGVPGARLLVVPPGIVPQTIAVTERSTIVCAGPLVPQTGFWDAIWTMDILHFVYDDLELVVAGTGPERSRLRRFAQRTGLGGRIHLVGEPIDRPALLAGAAVVWVPSRADTGSSIVLEAMAAGRPVVASRRPALTELVVDGETGWLVEPGDKMELAQKTRRLLDDPALRRSMGAAGQRRMEQCFSAPQFVRTWWQAWAG